jgi:hypothetical protein
VPLPAEVLIAGRLSADDVAELAHEFETVGLTAELRQVSPRRAVGDIAWLVLAAVPLKPFLDQLAKDFASDAYRRLKTLVGKVIHRGPPQASDSANVLLLQDSATGVQVVLEPDLPEEAYRQLLIFDLATLRRGPLHYDRHRRRWRSELDEADAASPAPAPDSFI